MQKRIRIAGVMAAALVFCGQFFLPQKQLGLPERVYTAAGQTTVIQAGLPLNVKVSASGGGVAVNGQTLENEREVDLYEPIEICATGAGETEVYFSWGGMTLRKMTVKSEMERTVIPGGQVVGVALYTRGALVVGTGEITGPNGIKVNPGAEAGLVPGDILLKINNTDVQNADHLAKLINGSKTEITARILREGKEQDVKILPAEDAVDGQYRIGLWVRDSTAGIGTVTYYDEKNQSFATLGHAIADADTNTNLLLKEGEIVEADVMGIQKGETGAPGELLGALVTDSAALGKITSNTEYGLYGKAYAKMESETYPNGIRVGWQDGVHTGKAQILCMLDDGVLQAYDCEIVRVNRQKRAAGKSMVIKVTDPALLKKTGGVVQGMSGSPLLQDGKLIGAVTHVFVNDPTRGYAVFIEWMLDQSDKVQ